MEESTTTDGDLDHKLWDLDRRLLADPSPASSPNCQFLLDDVFLLPPSKTAPPMPSTSETFSWVPPRSTGSLLSWPVILSPICCLFWTFLWRAPDGPAGSIRLSRLTASELANIQEAKTPAPDAATVPDQLMGCSLTGEFSLGHLIRQENHAQVYSAVSISNQGHFEARVYDLDGVSGKVRQYRLRNKSRLRSRAVLETQLKGLIIVVYRVEEMGVSSDEDDNPGGNDSRGIEGGSGKAPASVSISRQECARVKQRERRRARRHEKQHHDSTLHDGARHASKSATRGGSGQFRS